MPEVEIVYSKAQGFFQRELPAPPTDLKAGEVLVRPQRVGICGSDLKFLEIFKTEEICLGHEWVGVVEGVAKGSQYSVGDLVTSGAIIGCDKCVNCLDGLTNLCNNGVYIGSDHKGMMRSWAVIPERGIIKAPNKDIDAVPLLEVAAVADEAFIQLQSMSTKKSKLLVLGAGPVGLFTALKAKKEGYDFDLIEVEASRIKRALELGLPAKSLGEFLLDRNNYHKYNLLIDCSGDGGGKAGIWKYFNHISGFNMKGVIVGKYSEDITLNPKIVGDKSITLKWMRGMPLSTLKASINAWADEIEGLSASFISHIVDKSEVSKGFELALDRKSSMKVMVRIQD